MSGSVVPFNFTLPPVAGLWVYAPYKQGIAEAAWNASYTESTSWPDPKTQDTVGAGISYFRTQYPQGQVSINFAGTGIYLCYTDNGADYVLSLDGKADILKIAPGDSDDACKATGASTMAYANNLELGGHIATLRTAASPSNEFQFFGGQLTTTVPATGDVGKAPKVVDKWVDDTDPAFIFQPPSGGLDWDRNGGGAGLHNLTATYHCRWGENNLTSYSFTGAGAAALYGRAWRDTHDFTVDIQGGSVKETLVSAMSTSGWYMSQALVWMRGNLDPKTTYTITYRDYSSSNPTCIVNYPIGADRHPCCVGLDAVKLFSAEAGETTGEKPPPKPKSSSNIGPIVGGVVGGLACAAAIFALFIFMLRRKRKQKEKQEIDPAHWGTTSVPATYTTSSDPRYGAAAATPWSPMPTHSSPPASTVQTNNYFGAPSSIAPSTHATAPATAPAPLGQADMDRVLEFVQRQMDTRPVGRDEDEGGTVLPPYSHH